MSKKLKKRLTSLAIILLSLLVISCKAPETFSFNAPGLFPEGLEYDKGRQSFLITSLTEGKVSGLSSEGVTTLIDDPELISAIGITIDKVANRLLVCSSDPGVSKKTSPATQRAIARLAVYDLKTMEPIKYLNLHTLDKSGRFHFCNDIALDSSGNAYVTDSFSQVVYKIDANLEAEVFVDDRRIASKSGGFGPNGLVVIDDSFLLMAQSTEGKIFKIDLVTREIKEVELDEDIVGADGIIAFSDTKIAQIVNAQGKVVIFESGNEWASATATQVYERDYNANYNFDFPTTGALIGKTAYVLNAKLSTLFGGDRGVNQFEVIKLQ